MITGVIGDSSRGARVVFRYTCFNFAYEVGTVVVVFGVNAATVCMPIARPLIIAVAGPASPV